MFTFLRLFLKFYFHEGTRQAGMLAFPFAAAREREKLVKRVSHRLADTPHRGNTQCFRD